LYEPLDEVVASGDNLSFVAHLQCSIPEGCNGVTMTLTAPAQASGPGEVSAPPSEVTDIQVDADNNIIVSADQIVAGHTLDLTVSWPTVDYYTVPGTETSTMSAVATNGDGVPSTDDASVIVEAAPNLALSKAGPTEAVFGSQVTYTIHASNNLNDPTRSRGNLAVENAELVDTLPPGTIFVEASDGGIYDPGTHTVTWAVDTDPDRPGDQLGPVTGIPGEVRRQVTIAIPDDFPGTTINNLVDLNCTPFGDPDTQLNVHAEWPTVVGDTGPTAAFSKSFLVDQVADGQTVFARLFITNTGTGTIDAATLDNIPPGFDPLSVGIEILGSTAGWPAGDADITVFRGAGSEELFTYPGFEFPIPQGGEQITQVRVDIRGIPAGTTVVVRLEGQANAAEVGGPGEVENCATFSIHPGEPTGNERCDTFTILERLVWASLSKLTSQTPAAPLTTHLWTVTVVNDPTGVNSSPLRPRFVELLPPDLNYVVGSWALVAGQDPVECPATDQFTVTVLEGQARGRTAVIAEAVDALIPPNGTECRYQFQTTVRIGASPGTRTGNDPGAEDYPGNVICLYDAESPFTDGTPSTDTGDCDNDGDTTEDVSLAAEDFAIAYSSELLITKLVKGDLDAQFIAASEVPAPIGGGVATSNISGTVDFQILVGNNSARPLTNVVAYDLLPAPGTPGVTSGRFDDPLISEWRPTLTGPISAGGAPVEIAYSTSGDPCRPELDNTPDDSASFNCDGPAERLFVPASQVTDWTTIRSLRLDFGDHVFENGESHTITFTMQVPAVEADGSTFEGGEITWNKTAGQGDRVDGPGELSPLLATEPAWVAVQVFPLTAVSLECSEDETGIAVTLTNNAQFSDTATFDVNGTTYEVTSGTPRIVTVEVAEGATVHITVTAREHTLFDEAVTRNCAEPPPETPPPPPKEAPKPPALPKTGADLGSLVLVNIVVFAVGLFLCLAGRRLKTVAMPVPDRQPSDRREVSRRWSLQRRALSLLAHVLVGLVAEIVAAVRTPRALSGTAG
ncbi:MAG: hypothetical protein ACRD0U_07550, partial [Acidimicrobiales bacterium]